MSAESILLLYSLLLFFFFFHLPNLQQLYRGKNITEKVRWIASKQTEQPKYNDYYGGENLNYYLNVNNDEFSSYTIKGTKINRSPLTISKEYQIDFDSAQEKLYVSEILESFKKHKIDNFFRENKHSLSGKHKAIYKMRDLDYFMFSLLCYLENCVKYDSYDFRDKIYEKEDWFDKSYFKCKLTDCGRVYYKIYLIASMYCENSDFTKPLILIPQSSNIMENLRKNEVVFWNKPF